MEWSEGGDSGSGESGHLVEGQIRFALTDGQHDGAVGPDGVSATVPVASGSPSVAVFEPVVPATLDVAVALIGGSMAANPLVDVVDLGEP